MIDYSTGDYAWRLACRCRGSVIPRAILLALPAAIFSVVLLVLDEQLAEVREWLGISAPKATLLWAAVTAPLFTMISFRTSEAMRRFWEGTGLLHAMRGEWFDSASCLMTFTMPAKKSKPELVSEFRHTLLRLMSLCHGSALDELKNTETEDYEVIDTRGLDEDTINILRQCKQLNFNRVEVLLHMIQVLVIDAQQAGVICVPPPILSRVYQTLSRGFVNLLNAKKIKDTRFPFPYAQLSALMLIVVVFFTPVAMSAMLPQKGWCAMATFFPVFGLFCLNYTAEELEMPFGEDPNDLPLCLFQEEMNSSLLMLVHDSSDHVARTRKSAIKGFTGLMMSLHDTRNSLASFYVNPKTKRRRRRGHKRPSIFLDEKSHSNISSRSDDQGSEVDGCDDEDLNSQWSSEIEDEIGEVKAVAENRAKGRGPAMLINGLHPVSDVLVEPGAPAVGALEPGVQAPNALPTVIPPANYTSGGAIGSSARANGVLHPASAAIGAATATASIPGTNFDKIDDGVPDCNGNQAAWSKQERLGGTAAVRKSPGGRPDDNSGGGSVLVQRPTPEMSRPKNSSWSRNLMEAPPAGGGLACHGPQPMTDLPKYFDLKL